MSGSELRAAPCWPGALPSHCALRGLPEERSPQIAQMCLVKDAMFPEGWAGTLRTPLRPSGGLMSSLLLTGFMGELSWGRGGAGVSPGRLLLGTCCWARKVLPHTPFTERETEAQRGALPTPSHVERPGPAPLSAGGMPGTTYSARPEEAFPPSGPDPPAGPQARRRTRKAPAHTLCPSPT